MVLVAAGCLEALLAAGASVAARCVVVAAARALLATGGAFLAAGGFGGLAVGNC